LSDSHDEQLDALEGLSRLSAAMGYSYTHFNSKQIIKIRQSMDIFLDKILDMMDPRIIDLLVVKEYKEKIRKAIINAKDEEMVGK